MRVTLRTDGGLAALPGLNRTLKVDRDKLTSDQAGQLDRLIAGARLATRSPRDVPPTYRDARTYTLTVDDGAQPQIMSFADGTGDAALIALRDFVRNAGTVEPTP